MRRLLHSINVAGSLIVLLLALAASESQAQYDPFNLVIVSPTNGAVFPLSTNISLVAQGLGIAGVSFYADGALLPGHVENPIIPGGGVGRPTIYGHTLIWTNPPAGVHTLVAGVAGGIMSQPVYITVGTPQPTPVVRITSPANHAVIYAPANIPLFAFATDLFSSAANSNSASISNVEFFAGTNDLGSGLHVIVDPPGGTLPPTLFPPNEYTLLWTDPAPGTYALTAVATDTLGHSATSTPVNVTILPSHIVTNGTDVVSIVASDPVAIEGTNCWTWPGLAMATPDWASWKAPSRIFITNCGPKDATFTVRRAGDTSNNLVVSYSITGTASNGVDYVLLPGTVTIPAGNNYAFINVVPIPDTLPEGIETVVLTIVPSPLANPLPNYIIGIPRSAAAIIVDSLAPRPITGPLPGPFFHLNASGPDGAWFCVMASSNLLDWAPVSTNQVVNGGIDFVDPVGMSAANSFYQLVPQSVTPLQ